MRRLVFLQLVILAGLAACDSRKDATPFYLTHVEEMKKLPEEDLLRMKEDILARSAKLPDQVVKEPRPGGTVLSRGSLNPTPKRGSVEGEAKLFRLPDGSFVLRLEGFRLSNAPDLHVVVQSAGRGKVVVRKLLGNAGSQNFQLPGAEYRTVEIRSLLFDETLAETVLQNVKD